MADQGRIRVFASGGAANRSGFGALALSLAALLVLAVGFLLGRATAPGRTSPGRSLQTRNPGPTRIVSGVPVGYAHSEEGAVAAALNYGAVAARKEFLNPSRRRVILGIAAIPAFARDYERLAAPGLAAALRGPLGQGFRAGVPTVYESAPLAYKVISYTPQRAVISGWGMALSGNTSGFAPQVDFETSRSTLVWSSGDWKLSDGSSADGPTPRLSEQSRPTPAAQLIHDLQDLRTVHYAP